MALLQALGEAGITIVLVTHEPDIARYAGRVLEMKDGRLRSDLRRPALRAVPAAAAPEDGGGLAPAPDAGRALAPAPEGAP
jgi:putative ABC transport system ATP-binding protein